MPFYSSVLGWCCAACRAVGSVSVSLSKGVLNRRGRKNSLDLDHPTTDYQLGDLYMSKAIRANVAHPKTWRGRQGQC